MQSVKSFGKKNQMKLLTQNTLSKQLIQSLIWEKKTFVIMYFYVFMRKINVHSYEYKYHVW